MNLNSERLIPAFCSMYSGICLYFSNSLSQASAESGGKAPVTGFHSVIESPLSVSLVRPPTAIITHTSANRLQSQIRMGPRAPCPPRSIAPGVATCFSVVPTSSKIERGLSAIVASCLGRKLCAVARVGKVVRQSIPARSLRLEEVSKPTFQHASFP